MEGLVLLHEVLLHEVNVFLSLNTPGTCVSIPLSYLSGIKMAKTSSSQPSVVAGEIWVQALIYSSPDDPLRICTSVPSTMSASLKKKQEEGAKAVKGGNS